jgi:hypothetical protein
MSALIAPFFRASLTIGPEERLLFACGTPPPVFLEAVRRSAPILRQDLRRLFAGALLAEAKGGRLVFVEGWRSNRLVRATRRRFVTGSWIFALFLRALRRRGLVRVGVRPLRVDHSRCTSQEAEAIARASAAQPDPPQVVGIADSACPSARRAQRYLKCYAGPSAVVVTPEAALDGLPLSAEQAEFWRAVAPRPAERWLAPLVEAPNWIVSSFPRSVEVSLARALRPDRR